LIIPGGDCLCLAQHSQVCRPYTRVNLLLPRIDFGGTWRLETKGQNAAEELRWVDNMIAELNQLGQIVMCVLRVDVRSSWKDGRKQNYVVPKLQLKTSLEALMQGEGTIAELGRVSGPLELTPPIIEVVADEEPSLAERASALGAMDEVSEKIWALVPEVLRTHPGYAKDDDDLMVNVIHAMSKGTLTDLKDCSPTQRVKIHRLLMKVLNEGADLP
jgi:hypothetical protein